MAKRKSILRKRKRMVILAVVLLVLITLFFSFAFPESILSFFKLAQHLAGRITGFIVGFFSDLRLEISDDTDTFQKFTFCSAYCGPKQDKQENHWRVRFYANFTNTTAGSVIDRASGSCSIRFYTGVFSGFADMGFNTTSNLWEYNSSFTSKGNHSFFVNCSSSATDAFLSDNFTISNTPPYIIQVVGGTIDVDGDRSPGLGDLFPCQEDTLCVYNFTANISEDDLNDFLSYGYNPSPANTTLTNFTLNSQGILQINVTQSSYTGAKQIELNVRDSGDSLIPGTGITQAALLKLNVQEVNDAPLFLNLINRSFNETQPFTYLISASDEEGNTPFSFNVTFDSCALAPWSTRTNCTLFEITNYSATQMLVNFTPTGDDVGNYTLTFFITDLNNNVAPYNATRNKTVTFYVLNVNDAPFFTSVCENTNASEDAAFTCRINASDVDNTLLTFSSNLTWFLNATNATFAGSGGNASVLASFTPRDEQVGNWRINISVQDYGEPRKSNSTVISFYVANVNDSVFLPEIQNITAYKNARYLISLNASDDDFLIPDKSVLNEQLNFSANVSWITFILGNVTGNTTFALMNFTINDGVVGNHTILVTVRDRYSFSSFSRAFTVFAYNNTAPLWNLSPDFPLTEDDSFFLNLNNNVSDPDGDAVTFRFLNFTSFPSFALLGSIITFFANDSDVGLQKVLVNASDGKLGVSQQLLTFNISNKNDFPLIQNIGDQNATEDSRTRIFVDLFDDDLRVKQKDYFNESLSYNITIVGPNPNLFSLQFDSQADNFVRLVMDFTPRKTDAGNYTVLLNAIDSTGFTNATMFNLAIAKVNHAPDLGNISNASAGVGIPFFLDFNATDIEDGDEGRGNITYAISFLSGTTGLPFFGIDSRAGIINFTANASRAGKYRANLSAADSKNLTNSTVFWIFVYDMPRITSMTSSPLAGAENTTLPVNVKANHTVGDDLRFDWYVNTDLRNSSLENGTNKLITFNFRLTFNDETTCGRDKNLTLNVSNLFFSDTTSWTMNISHVDDQPHFIGPINNISAGNTASLCLLSYFIDADYGDICYPNASMTFSFTRYNETLGEQLAGPLTASFVHDSGAFCTDTAVFSSSSQAGEYFSLRASDGGFNVSSNIFHVALTPQSIPVPQPQPSTGASERPKPEPKFLKIITPGKITVLETGLVQVPIIVENTGDEDLFDVNLSTLLFRDGRLIYGNVTLSKDFFSVLTPRVQQNVSIKLFVNGTGRVTYELIVNATVRSPRFADWAKVNIELLESNITEVEKILVFTEELIVENPECLELKELLNEAKKLQEQGRVSEALQKTDQIVDACKKALSQKNRLFFIEKKDFSLVFYVVVLSIAFLFSGVLYHFLRRWIFRKKKEQKKFS